MRTVLITGASRGIGLALAEKFLSEGWRVIGTSLSVRDVPTHENLEMYTLDLRLDESIRNFVSAVQASGQSIDVLINNAGVLLDEDSRRLKIPELRETLEVNLIGTASLTEQLEPLVPAGGHIMFISSTAGSFERSSKAASHSPFHYPAYKISKAALNMYVVTLSHELTERDVTVSAIHPGWVRTDMGGDEADLTPAESAERIYARAIDRPETGGFWFGLKRQDW